MRLRCSTIKPIALSITLLLCVPFATALASPTINVDTTPMEFSPPSFMVGTGSSEVLRLIGNSGADPLRFVSRITGANPDDFTLGACSQATVLPGVISCKIQIGFRPTATGPRTAILELKTNDPAATKVQIQLNGIATVAAPRVSAYPSQLVFGTQPIGVASSAQHIAISNSGTILLTVTSVTINNMSEFSVSTDCMAAPVGRYSGRCTANVTFTPKAGGPRQAVLTVISDDPRGAFMLPLTGMGAAPAVSVAPANITFGTAEVGNSIEKLIILENTGSAALNVTAASISGANATDFTVKSGLPCTASRAGDRCGITLRFFASAFGPRRGQVSFSTNVLDGQPSVPLSGFGTTFAEPPPPLPDDDHHFVGKVTGSGCKTHGSKLNVTAPVSRVIGGLNPSAAVASGTLAPLATLEIMALESSSTALHTISVNETPAATMLATTPGSWTLRTVTFPAALLKFPAQAVIGLTPKPEPNTIDIDLDTTNVGGCINIAWVRLSFKAMSPVILIHGNNSDGGFFVRQGFAGALTTASIANDSSINLTRFTGGAATIARNTFWLQCWVPAIVRSFGVNSIHIVAHSKGGLDARLWLSQYASYNSTERQPVRDCVLIVGNDLPRNPAFNVISLTTLSTPHLGSALADLAIATEASGIALFGCTVKEMRDLGLSDGGTPNLTTFFTAGFNPPLPPTIDYRMLGGDTDLNGDGGINSGPVDEYVAARSENPTLTSIFTSPPITIGRTTITGPQKADTLATLFHQFLSAVSSVSVLSTTILIPPFPLLVTITHPVPTFAAAPAPNDLLVTLGSANGGPAPFISAAPLSSFTLAAGRDHASIANAGVAAIVIPQLIITDLTRGDLK
jgi:hypothetical protein